MEQLATLRRSQACFGRFPTLSAQARGGEGLEGALRLGREHACAALDLAMRKRNAAVIFERRRKGFALGRRFGQVLGRPGKLGD